LQNISQVNLTAQPVIISGKDFLQKIGIKDSDESFNWPDEENKAAGISISSLRLVEKGNELPLQVDKRDSAGFFIKRAEDFLEQDDEIVFMVDIPAGQQANYYIYFSHKPKKRRGQLSADYPDCPSIYPDYPEGFAEGYVLKKVWDQKK
jgi:hypothetical protein